MCKGQLPLRRPFLAAQGSRRLSSAHQSPHIQWWGRRRQMDNLKDEMNASALAGQQQGPGKRIAAESNREYILQKTPIKPEAPARLGMAPTLPCSGSSACAACQRVQGRHQAHVGLLKCGSSTALRHPQLQSFAVCREASLTALAGTDCWAGAAWHVPGVVANGKGACREQGGVRGGSSSSPGDDRPHYRAP